MSGAASSRVGSDEPRTTRAAFLFGAGDIRWHESPLGELAPGRARVRFGAGGICGSDLHYFRHGKSGDFVLNSPLVLGHEIAGTVESVRGAVGGLGLGDRVAVNPARPCGVCGNCRAGRANLCDNIFFLGSASRTPHMQGGFAEYFDVAAEQCITIPAGVPFEEAALCEPLAVALHAVTRAAAALRASGIDSGGVSFTGKNISVFGAGPIGLMILLALRQSGADQVTLIDIDDMPLELASRLGAAAVVNSNSGSSVFGGSRESDLAFEASGSPTGLADALRNLRKGGALVQVGNLPAGEVPVPMNLVMSKELTVFGTFRFSEEFAQAVQLVASRAIDVAPLITARVPLAEAARGFELALDRSSNIKVVLTGR